jgi:hypothetical protein
VPNEALSDSLGIQRGKFHSAAIQSRRTLNGFTCSHFSRHIEELRVSESIAIGLKRAAIILADELDYMRAAEKLSIPSVELQKQISALEAQLCFHIFKPGQRKVELTDEGQFLIKAFRESVALHDRNASKGSGNNQ